MPQNSVRQLFRDCAPAPLPERIGDAIEMGAILRPRIAGAMGAAFGIGAMMTTLLLPIPLGVGWLVWRFELPSGLETLLGRGAFFGAAWVVGLFAAGTILTWYRIVAIARRTGRAPVEPTRNHFGRAIEVLGPLRTMLWSAVLALALEGAVRVTIAGGEYIAELRSIPNAAGYAFVAALLAAVAYFLLFLPQLFVFSIFCRRDCGWAGAIESSVAFVLLYRQEALSIAWRTALWPLTIMRLPAAITLNLSCFDTMEPVLAVVLREKSVLAARDSMRDEIAKRPQALEKAYAMLEAGRYLDALNAFQMHRHSNRGDVEALRGESLALLYIGDRILARERLELWQRADPDSREHAVLIEELARGEWEDGQPKYEAAQQRCTQKLGRGV